LIVFKNQRRSPQNWQPKGHQSYGNQNLSVIILAMIKKIQLLILWRPNPFLVAIHNEVSPCVMKNNSCINLNENNQLIKTNVDVTPNAKWLRHIGFDNHVSNVLLMNIHLSTSTTMTSPTNVF
jgi:hypothetical protein